MSIANLQQNIHNRQLLIYNRAMSNYDADKFADWLSDSFNQSTFKSFAALADFTGLSRSTVSALAGAKKQPLTDKPSQPKAETVRSLAKALNEDVDKALLLAGHAPERAAPKKPTTVAEFFEVLDDLGLDVQFDGGIKMLETLDEDDLQELLDGIVANASAKVKRKMQGK